MNRNGLAAHGAQGALELLGLLPHGCNLSPKLALLVLQDQLVVAEGLEVEAGQVQAERGRLQQALLIRQAAAGEGEFLHCLPRIALTALQLHAQIHQLLLNVLHAEQGGTNILREQGEDRQDDDGDDRPRNSRDQAAGVSGTQAEGGDTLFSVFEAQDIPQHGQGGAAQNQPYDQGPVRTGPHLRLQRNPPSLGIN